MNYLYAFNCSIYWIKRSSIISIKAEKPISNKINIHIKTHLRAIAKFKRDSFIETARFFPYNLLSLKGHELTRLITSSLCCSRFLYYVGRLWRHVTTDVIFPAEGSRRYLFLMLQCFGISMLIHSWREMMWIHIKIFCISPVFE